MSYVDAFMHNATHHAANFAFRSSITFGASLLFKRLGKYMESNRVKPDDDFYRTRNALDRKINIITPSIDLIELLVVRGNTALGSITGLTSSIRYDITEISVFVQQFIETEASALDPKAEMLRRAAILERMNNLQRKIEESVPLISLALTTSGANMGSSLSSSVSPSILLKAHLCLSMADQSFEEQNGIEKRQIGPTFTMKMYSIFGANENNNYIAKDGEPLIKWKEEMAKCEVRVHRVPAADNMIMYELEIVENLDDGRYHEELEELYSSGKRDKQREMRGRTRILPVYMITNLYFGRQGRLLHIEDVLTPVLVLKVNHAVTHPQEERKNANTLLKSAEELERMQMDYYEKLKDFKNVEWLSFEIDPTETTDISGDFGDDSEYSDATGEDDDNDDISNHASPADGNALNLSLSELGIESEEPVDQQNISGEDKPGLSLLEYITRLATLQTTQQKMAANVADETLSLFLKDDVTRKIPRGSSGSSGTPEQLRYPTKESTLSPSSGRESTAIDERKPNQQEWLQGANKSHSSRSSRQSTPIMISDSEINEQTQQRQSRRSNRLSELSRKSPSTSEQTTPESRPAHRQIDDTMLTPWEKHHVLFRNLESTPSRNKKSRRPHA